MRRGELSEAFHYSDDLGVHRVGGVMYIVFRNEHKPKTPSQKKRRKNAEFVFGLTQNSKQLTHPAVQPHCGRAICNHIE